MNSVPGEAGASAVALPDGTGGRDRGPARNAEPTERIGADDHANLAGAVIDHESETVGEGRR